MRSIGRSHRPEGDAAAPEGWIPLEGLAVVLCLDEEGVRIPLIQTAPGLTVIEAIGLLVTAGDVQRDAYVQAFRGDDDE